MALCGEKSDVAPKPKQTLASGTAATAPAPKPPKLEAAALPPIIGAPDIGVGPPRRAAKEGGGAAPGAPEQGLAEPNAKCPPLDGGGAPKDGGGAAPGACGIWS